jgi:hypothetical protein
VPNVCHLASFLSSSLLANSIRLPHLWLPKLPFRKPSYIHSLVTCRLRRITVTSTRYPPYVLFFGSVRKFYRENPVNGLSHHIYVEYDKWAVATLNRLALCPDLPNRLKFMSWSWVQIRDLRALL